MLRIPRFAPPETLRVLACFRILKLGMLRIPRFAPPETLRVLIFFRTRKLGMLRIPRFARPETLRVLAALRKSAKDVRRASSPACFCGFAQGAGNYKIIPFSGRRLQPQPGSAFRGPPHPRRLQSIHIKKEPSPVKEKTLSGYVIPGCRRSARLPQIRPVAADPPGCLSHR